MPVGISPQGDNCVTYHRRKVKKEKCDFPSELEAYLGIFAKLIEYRKS